MYNAHTVADTHVYAHVKSSRPRMMGSDQLPIEFENVKGMLSIFCTQSQSLDKYQILIYREITHLLGICFLKTVISVGQAAGFS
jgi:hypothetical protein